MKRALILSGGGAKGAFSVGALKTLDDRGINQFDLISGSSTGALISALICAGELTVLRNVYRSVTNNDIIKTQNIIATLTANPPRPFLMDTTPLENMIDTHVTEPVYQRIRTSNTILCLTTVNLKTGRITVFSSKRIEPTSFYDAITIRNHGHLKKALLASSNQAAFLPPVTIRVGGEDQQFVDGGNREVIPTRVVANVLPTLAGDGNAGQDEVYIVSNNPSRLIEGEDQYTSFLNILFRALSIFIHDVRQNDLQIIRSYANDHNSKLILIEPQNDLDPDFSTGLRFDPAIMTGWMVQGEDKAEEVLNGIV